MSTQVILLLFVLLATGQSFNLRTEKNITLNEDGCKVPCTLFLRNLLPGNIIGTNSEYGSIYFFEEPNYVNRCCSQGLTYEGFNIPDFTNIEVLNFPDEMTLRVEIKKAFITPHNIKEYNITIFQYFERRALNVSLAPQYLTVNMTLAEDNKDDLYTCNRKDWKSEYKGLGEKVFTSLVLGIFQEVEVNFFTNYNYTESEVLSKYWNHIQTRDLDSILDEFPYSRMNYLNSYGGFSGPNFEDYKNWPTFISSLRAKDYHFSYSSLNPQIPKFTDMDSYRVFDKKDEKMQECSFYQWHSIFLQQD